MASKESLALLLQKKGTFTDFSWHAKPTFRCRASPTSMPRTVFIGDGGSERGANREKLTVKKIINNEMFFFTVYVPYKP